ncbi:MAG: NADH-quinone oxidoreductase subunit L [Bacteroidetes bacterium]|nr:NADH-quinone oxidoreductase subunit L [Bacteroidota bacterium]
METILLPLGFYLSALLLIRPFKMIGLNPGDVASIFFLGSFFSLLLTFLTFKGNAMVLDLNWFRIAGTSINFSLSLDHQSLPVWLFVSLTGLAITFWSKYYLGKGDHERFYLIISLFMIAMALLLVSANMLLTFFAWELVGLCSYLLIAYNRDDAEAIEASRAALIINKAGDLGFIVALMVIYKELGTFGLSELQTSSGHWSNTSMTIAAAGLLTAIVAKSAQFPLHSWLPAAMAGPTPVSALLHSATMVAAGVFLLYRFNFIFPEDIRHLTGIIGATTTLLGGWNALTQRKIKALLAYSTLSQLGLMVMTAGWGNPEASVFHLVSHGLTKAGLFLMAGIWMMEAGKSTSENELEHLGNAGPKAKKSSIILLMLTLMLTGFPLSATFLSKEFMLSSLPATAPRLIFIVSSLLTILYTGRLLWYLKPFSGSQQEERFFSVKWASPILLTILGVWIFWNVNPLGSGSHLFPSVTHHPLSDMLPGVGIIAGSWFALWLLWNTELFQTIEKYLPELRPERLYLPVVMALTTALQKITLFIDQKILDGIANLIGYGTVTLAHLIGFLDRFLVDGFILLSGRLTKFTGSILRRPMNGQIAGYLWWTVTGLMLLLFWQWNP